MPSMARFKREFFIDNLLVRIHFIILMIRWTDLAPWEFEFPFPGSLTSTRSKATLVGLGQIELRTSKMRTSRWTVIISKQVICTAKSKFETLHVQKSPSTSSHLVTSKFDLAKSYQSGCTTLPSHHRLPLSSEEITTSMV